MASSLPPIDESVTLPASVLRAARAAESIHKQAYPDAPPGSEPVPAQVQPAATQPAIQDGDRPINIVATDTSTTTQPAVQPTPAVQPVPVQTQPQSDPAAVVPSPQPDNWEHRYLSMKGRYDQSQATMAGMQEQMAEMGNELSRVTAMLNSGQRPQDPKAPAPIITPKDLETYGPELVEFTQRAAKAAVAPNLSAIEQENQRLRQTVQRQAATHVYGELDVAIPNWREINTDPRFVDWLRLRDVYSNQIRGRLLRAAFAASNVPSILAFFNGFLAEEQATGQRPAPQSLPAATAPRTATVPLATLAAPGVRPAADLQQPADKPIFTHRQIAEFYSHTGRARYVGRDEDRRKDEQEIFAAQREGRIR